MTMGPDKAPYVWDLLNGSGGAVTTTGAGPTVVLPPGKKALQVNMGTGIVATLKVQNSVDGTNWFDVTSNTTAAAGNLWELDSIVPKWRANFTVMTTAATTASPFVAVITQGPV